MIDRDPHPLLTGWLLVLLCIRHCVAEGEFMTTAFHWPHSTVTIFEKACASVVVRQCLARKIPPGCVAGLVLGDFAHADGEHVTICAVQHAVGGGAE